MKRNPIRNLLNGLFPHAQELQDGYGVLPSIIFLGQAILESNWGKVPWLANTIILFGIKAYGDQKKSKPGNKGIC